MKSSLACRISKKSLTIAQHGDIRLSLLATLSSPDCTIGCYTSSTALLAMYGLTQQQFMDKGQCHEKKLNVFLNEEKVKKATRQFYTLVACSKNEKGNTFTIENVYTQLPQDNYMKSRKSPSIFGSIKLKTTFINLWNQDSTGKICPWQPSPQLSS